MAEIAAAGLLHAESRWSRLERSSILTGAGVFALCTALAAVSVRILMLLGADLTSSEFTLPGLLG